MSDGAPEVSILVRTRNDAPFIAKTLDAIAAQEGAPSFEVVVCDDDSTDGTSEILKGRNGLRFVTRPAGEYRPGRTLNAMVREARGEIVVFNNADAIPLDGRWLAALTAPLQATADGVTGRAVAPATAAIATFAQQVPRADAEPLVKKDYARAFGDGSVSKDWPRFFSLASSAFRRDWLLENPFDETILYSEDIELVNRFSGCEPAAGSGGRPRGHSKTNPLVRRYVAEARVEHSHNYDKGQWARRFYGEGYAEQQIFGDPVPGRLRVAAQAAVEALRDAKYLKSAAAFFAALARRLAQKFAWRRGMADAARGVAPKTRSTAAAAGFAAVAGATALPAAARFAAAARPSAVSLRSAVSAATIGQLESNSKPFRFLFTGVYSQFNGGLERFAARAADELRRAGHSVDVVGDVPRRLGFYDRVVMQKVPRRLADLRRLKLRYGDRLRFYAHDHELYCLRRHYYDPKRRPCDRAYSFFPCRLCAAVTRPQWVFRALTRDVAGFIREMRDVTTFVQCDYMRGNLLKNGFAPERLMRLAPFWTDETHERHDFLLATEDGRHPLRILFAGQLVAGKGVAVLLDAVAKLEIDWTLTIVGAGRDEAALKARAEALPAGRVKFAGWQPSIAPFLATADVVAVPSLWNEPFCMVGAEALAAGTPVVAFDRGGIGDWLRPDVTGLFAAAANDLAGALADALTKMADSAILSSFSRNGAALVRERYSTKQFLEGICR
jgi:rhamnosyltransferase